MKRRFIKFHYSTTCEGCGNKEIVQSSTIIEITGNEKLPDYVKIITTAVVKQMCIETDTKIEDINPTDIICIIDSITSI